MAFEARKSTFDQQRARKSMARAYIGVVTARCSGSAMRERLAALGMAPVSSRPLTAGRVAARRLRAPGFAAAFDQIQTGMKIGHAPNRQPGQRGFPLRRVAETQKSSW
jgi:hypothetical protein